MALQHKDKSWQKYIDLNSPRSVPIIRDKGMSVWSVIGYYRVYEEDREQLLATYCGELTEEELDAALAYYQDYPEGIDRKLWEIANDGPYISG